MKRRHQAEDQVSHAGGKVLSTPVPPYHLIPKVVLDRLAARFALGLAKKGSKSWHAGSDNQGVLLDSDYAVERLDHVIKHAMVLREKLVARDYDGLSEDDDAAAICWGGAFAIAVTDALGANYG
jgi:hypothetical protein